MADLHLCHQCRRAKHDVVSCTYKKENKSCNLKYCRKCIQKRYNPEEKASAESGNWVCPKCRGECQCSICRTKRGLLPIGRLISDKKRKYVEMACCAKEQLQALQWKESLLPKATIPVTKVAGIEMAAENVGPALQFLEHCKIFSQAHELKDGEPESILEEIAQGWDGSRAELSALANFQIGLLRIILTGEKSENKRRRNSSIALAGDAWVFAVERLIDSKSLFRTVPREHFQSSSCYHELDANWKLRILNLLCDLALETENLMPFIPSSNIPKEMEMHWEELPASQQVIVFWRQLKNEEAGAMKLIEDGMIHTFEEEQCERRLSYLKNELNKACHAMLGSLKDIDLGTESSKKTAKILMSDPSGRTYFEIVDYVERASILVQDVENQDHLTSQENVDKWYTLPREDERIIREHCSSKRIWEAILKSAQKRIPKRKLDKLADESNGEEDSDKLVQDDHENEGSDSFEIV